jgi:predicted ATPase/DNA-binding CsgD family transcriptional regulator
VVEVGVSAAARRAGGLPVSPNALVGRDSELAALAGLLLAVDTRLVTLTGPPGVGKTRLAVAAASAVADRFADGVVFVDLTPVRDPALVPVEVARALGVGAEGRAEPGERLARELVDKALLLVLDNVEHVLSAGPGIAAPLATCPRLRVLATSRERLHVGAEREVLVNPLALPVEGDTADPERFAETASVQLLVQRVRGFQPDFRVTEANAAALAEVCVRLDGLPLALELAAARLRLFTPGELTFRLRNRLRLLTDGARDAPDRHRTLHTALAWSHDLLAPNERAMFRRLSVFVGGWTLEAAAQVCEAADEVGGLDSVETLASLVDKSLVRRRDVRLAAGAVAEFVMLESLREYAGEQLARSGELAETRSRHARYFVGRATRTESEIGTSEETRSLDRAGHDEPNLRAALAHCLEVGEVGLALSLVGELGWYLYTRGRLGEGQAILDRTLAAAEGAPPDDPLAAALLIAAVIAFARADLEVADTHLARAIEVNDRVGCRRRVAIGSAFRGHLARARGEHDEAVYHYHRAGSLHEQLGHAPGVAWSRYDLGLLARWRGDLDAAAEHLLAALAAFREMDYSWAVGCSGWALACVGLRRGELCGASALLAEALDAFDVVPDDRGIAQCLEAAADVAVQRGAHHDAGRLLGAAAVRRERLAAPLPDEDRSAQHAVTGSVRRGLGPVAADRARRAGRELSRQAAVALARRVLADQPMPLPEPANPLTARERQVALLVAGGRTNRQVGRALGITEKTTEVHVHNIIRKLGASSRAEVAAWVAVRPDHAAD